LLEEEGMNKTLLAVFGHYDSRGGTMAVPMKEATEEELKEAMKRYEKEFCWEPDDGPGPAEHDFMFVAELHHPEDPPILGQDLEELGRVVIDTTLEPEDGEKRKSLIDPVELEFVPLADGWDEDIRKAQQEINEEANKQGVCTLGWDSRWTDEQRKVQAELEAKYKELDKKAEVRIIQTIKKLVGFGLEVRRWDDDAYGFFVLDKSLVHAEG
jgi:hypothetical protein